ncbi:apses-domain-containing protein [Auriculariales sp. MPI-PUGE-AT-0066]|nr:apses-domain-containing protein [Auriculariales sp. MPI-PUGE-AT-0066]
MHPPGGPGGPPGPPGAIPRPMAPPIKIYNAVYSSVQVYECMVRGIAVMRRRPDSYVNATQILKVAGIEKGRRTKILEKDILPGKHDIVQGGYGKYQGTWIPLDRGRELATQYGVGPLLAPLFDFIPHAMPPFQPPMPGMHPGYHPQAHRFPPGAPPLMPGFGYPNMYPHPYMGHPPPPHLIPPGGPINAIKPGNRPPGAPSPGPTSGQAPRATPLTFDPHSRSAQEAAAVANTLKRPRPSVDGQASPSMAPLDPERAQKRARMDVAVPPRPPSAANGASGSRRLDDIPEPTPSPLPLPPVGRHSSKATNGAVSSPRIAARLATKASTSESVVPLRNMRRTTILSILTKGDDPGALLDHIKETAASTGNAPDWDVPVDDQGHTALHLAATFARQNCCEALVQAGADIQRGNAAGETPLVRAALSTHSFEAKSFEQLVALLAPSIRTLDKARRSVLHHIVLVGGVKGRAPAARNYLHALLKHLIASNGSSHEFRTWLDLTDSQGDTAMQIAARVGDKVLVKTLLDVGADPAISNKFGLRALDYGLLDGEGQMRLSRSGETVAAEIKAGPPAPLQKSDDVIADLTAMIHSLRNEFADELAKKDVLVKEVRADLQTQTRSLGEHRQHESAEKARGVELDLVQARIRNLQGAMVDEQMNSWGLGPGSSTDHDREDNSGADLGIAGTDEDEDEPLPGEDSRAALLRLRRMRAWHARVDGLVTSRIEKLRGSGIEREQQYKRLVSLTTNTPFEDVDNLIQALIVALENDSSVDLARISGFMRKVKDESET